MREWEFVYVCIRLRVCEYEKEREIDRSAKWRVFVRERGVDCAREQLNIISFLIFIFSAPSERKLIFCGKISKFRDFLFYLSTGKSHLPDSLSFRLFLSFRRVRFRERATAAPTPNVDRSSLMSGSLNDRKTNNYTLPEAEVKSCSSKST